ncbi:hypothetical protein M3Y94_01212400 [Aphelenchoides besseyi]|nr:hypothetical protein M3Y94_01212400 [Aphelenchoides besseyi]KAI6228536.1 hypothetical protein M3Y95_00632500 [Aphelenchoides besseyi]
MWEYVALTLLLIFVAYEVDKSRKARGESGIPLLGYIFDSVSFNVREEIDGEDLTKSSDKKKSKKHKHRSRRSGSSSNKKKHRRHRKSKSNKSERLETTGASSAAFDSKN